MSTCPVDAAPWASWKAGPWRRSTSSERAGLVGLTLDVELVLDRGVVGEDEEVATRGQRRARLAGGVPAGHRDDRGRGVGLLRVGLA